ncbi:MAG: hypothetical protein E7578_00045 [Ruminococcaceae bacterium]|nr:hypothetical protein [Oscillospiraceae bacterium]
MTFEIFAEKIGLSAAAKEVVMNFSVSDEENDRLYELFLNDYDEFEKIVKEKEDPNRFALGLIGNWGVRSLSIWQEKGFPEDIAIATLYDLTIWSNRCFDRTGKVGLIEWRWFIVHITARIFRLGRLQFEPGVIRDEGIPYPDGTPIPVGTPILGVHIPRGDGFKPDSIRESFEEAKKFFPKYFGKEYDTYICTSWLLAPQLESMISETSSIAYFRSYFTVYGEHTGYSQAEEYVFLEKLEDKTKYPEDTSLRRNLKKFLLDGGEIGMGKAVGKF